MRPLSHTLALLLAALSTLALTACERAPATHSQVPDASTRPHEPRIVALSPAIAVMLDDLGLRSRIVGRHGFDLSLPPSIPVVGDQAGIDYEALLRVNPTSILLQWGDRPLPPRLVQLAAERSWDLRTYALLSLDEIRSAAVDLYRLFPPDGTSARATDEGPLAAAFDRAFAPRSPSPARAGRVLLLSGVDPATALGPGSFHHDILLRIGGTPAITDGSPFITLDAEDIARLAPDAIVLVLPRHRDAPAVAAPTPAQLLARLGPLATLNIPALTAHAAPRIVLIDQPLALVPSSSMIPFADDLATGLNALVDAD